MIRKSIKKGAAIALATALSLSGIPIGITSAPVAVAATGPLSKVESVTLSLAKPDTTYQSITADGLASLVGASATVTVEKPEIVGIASEGNLRDKSGATTTLDKLKAGTVADGTAWTNSETLPNSTAKLILKGFKSGNTNITLTANDPSHTTQTIAVSVSDVTNGIRISDAEGNTIPEGSTQNVVAGGTITAKITLDGLKTKLSDLGHKSTGQTSGYAIDEKVATATFVSDTFTFLGVAEGKTEVTLYLVEDNKTVRFYINVLPQTKLSTTIGGKTYVYDTSWKCGEKDDDPEVFLNPVDTQVQLTVSSNNGNAVKYDTSASEIVVGNTGLVALKRDSSGKPIPGTYKVNVSVPANTKTGQEARNADITVIVSSKKAKLVSVKVSDGAAGSATEAERFIGEAAAEITGPDTYKKGESTGRSVILSMKNELTKTIKIESNVDIANFVSVTSSDESVVKASMNGTVAVLEAKKAGTANVAVTAKPDNDAEAYEASVTFPVTVSEKYTNCKIEVNPATLQLTDDKPTAVISAKATYGNTLSYPTLARVAVSTDPASERAAGCHDVGTTGENKELYDVFVSNNGQVTYKKNGKTGDIYVKVVGAANADSEAPTPVYVKVSYGKVEKQASDLKVSLPNPTELTVGQAVTMGAVSVQPLTYVSSAPTIASVDANGTITAVAAGNATITVTAAATDKYLSGEKTIVIIVKEQPAPAPTPEPTPAPTVEKKANPMTVTAKTITVKAKKLLKKDISKAVSKVLTIKNAKGTKTFTKKSGKAKITINKSTGKVLIKKGLKAGTYKVKVAVKAAGNATYKAITKTAKFTVIVK